jgi:hypothetical protein
MVAVPRGAEPRVSSNLCVKAFDGEPYRTESIRRSFPSRSVCPLWPSQEDDLHSAATAILGAYANKPKALRLSLRSPVVSRVSASAHAYARSSPPRSVPCRRHRPDPWQCVFCLCHCRYSQHCLQVLQPDRTHYVQALLDLVRSPIHQSAEPSVRVGTAPAHLEPRERGPAWPGVALPC